jgi:hypothetical protein
MNNGGFIAGACAIGAALIGAAGVAAIADWCCSETDEKLIARAEDCYSTIYNTYYHAMNYFGTQAGVGAYPPHRPIHTISESALYECATGIWNNKMSQSSYRAEVGLFKNKLQEIVQDLYKRIRLLEGKPYEYEQQQTLSRMHTLLKNSQLLLAEVTLFTDCLECHKTYFDMYDSVGHTYNRYAQEIAIFKSGSYSMINDLKQLVFSSNNNQYPFKEFVISIEKDTAKLQAKIAALAYRYEYARDYANHIVECLIGIRNIIATDPRHQQEIFHYEQARLERQRIQALEKQAQLDQERLRLERESNRIAAERNRIEQEKMRTVQDRISSMPMELSVNITL